MTILHGKNLKVMIGTNELERVEKVDFKPKTNKVEVSYAGSTGVSRIAGLVDADCTVTCWRDDTATTQDSLITSAKNGAAVTVKIYPDRNGSHYYQFVALVDFAPSLEVGSAEQIAFTFSNADGNAWTYV